MWQQLSKLLYQQKGIVGLSCQQQDGQWQYQLCRLERKKDQVEIEQQIVVQSLDTLASQLPQADAPIFLWVDAPNMLHRQLQHLPDSTTAALQAILPTAKVEDFYVQCLTQSNSCWVSVVRKSLIDQLLADLEAAELFILQIGIGPCLLGELAPLLPPDTHTISSPYHQLHFEQQQLQQLSKLPPATALAQQQASIQLGDDRLTFQQLPAFNMALLGITQPDFQGLALPELASKRVDWQFKQLFTYTLWIGLVVFFVALLGNYVLFDHYQKSYEELEVSTLQQQQLVDQRNALQEQYQRRKALLGDQLQLSQSKSSFYADQLAASLPRSIQLTRLEVFPQIISQAYQSEDELPRYDYHKILVAGQCDASVFYNNWKLALQELHWVAGLKNLSYQNDAAGHGLFELEIELKPQE